MIFAFLVYVILRIKTGDSEPIWDAGNLKLKHMASIWKDSFRSYRRWQKQKRMGNEKIHILFTVPMSENIEYLQITSFSPVLHSFSVRSTVNRSLKESQRQKGHLAFIMFKQYFYLLPLENNHQNNFSTENWLFHFRWFSVRRVCFMKEI